VAGQLRRLFIQCLTTFSSDTDRLPAQFLVSYWPGGAVERCVVNESVRVRDAGYLLPVKALLLRLESELFSGFNGLSEIIQAPRYMAPCRRTS